MNISTQKLNTGIPLLMLKNGVKSRIRNVSGGRGFQAKLAAMGIAPGIEIEIVNNNHRGPLVVKVLESRIIIGKGMAHKIFVE